MSQPEEMPFSKAREGDAPKIRHRVPVGVLGFAIVV
jgi:hypothetical protein